ncbi:MAG: hypothetical protein ABFD18_19120 [Syntrophomonas sp.]
MPAISRIRFTNLVYENGGKRYGDEIFQFDGHNGVILLENGGGKTVFVQAVLQTILPHTSLAERKAKNTFALENSPAHLAVEWIVNERPRRYALTAVTLFASREGIDSYKYVYEYEAGDEHSLENLPLVREGQDGKLRPASKEEMHDYYQYMSKTYMNAHNFPHNRDYQNYIEKDLKIIISEWRNIARINSAEGEIEGFFEGCKTTSQLVDQLLIPAVEEALAGNGTSDFVDTFEKQREHFKKHRQLRERIEESQRVDAQIKHYVDKFSAYHETGQSLLKVKAETKALYQLAAQQRDQVDENLRQHQAARESLQLRQHEQQRKQASYELAILQQNLNQAESLWKRSREEKESRQEDFDVHNCRRQNLELARLRAGIKTCAEEIAYYSSQLQALKADKDVQELEKQIEQNSGWIRFCYREEQNVLESQHQEMESYRQQFEEELQGINNRYQERREEYQELRVKRGRAEKQVELAEKEMQEIATQLLANPRHDDLHQEIQKWEKRIEELERSRNESERYQRNLNEERTSLIAGLPGLRQQLQSTVNEEQKLRSRLEYIEELHQGLLIKLKEMQSEMYSIDSIYLKQSTVIEYLAEAVEKIRSQKEQSLLKESQATSLFTVYQQSSYYSADPQVERWIEEWREQFQYLEAGTVYIQKAARHLSRAESDYFRVYPFWPITIICRASEVERLLTRINKQAAELNHPVFVLSQDEARNLVDSVDQEPGFCLTPGRQVFPSDWEVNLSGENFQGWKQELEKFVNEASTNRKNLEAELQRGEEFFNQVKAFLDKYPYKEYVELRQQVQESREQVLFLQQAIRNKETRLDEISGRLDQLQTNLREQEAEQLDLSYRVRQAQTYLRKEAERDKAHLEIQQYDELVNNKKQDLTVIEKQMGRVQEKLEELRQNLYRVQEDIRHLKLQPLYKEVKGISPLKTTLTRTRLEMERKDLLDALHQKQEGRQSIEERLITARTSREKLEKDLHRQSRQCDYDIDEVLTFPPGGDEEIDALADITRALKIELQKLSESSSRAEKEYAIVNDRFQLRQNDFFKQFKDRVLFTESLVEIKDWLDKETKELELQEKYLDKQAIVLTKEKESVTRALTELEKEDGRYEFLPEEVSAGDLPASTCQDFPYQRMKVIAGYIKRLQDEQNQLKYRTLELDEEKRHLESFCQEQVRDIKLKEMVMAGVKNRDSYQQVLEWKNRLNDRIARTIRIAEDDIREHDLELQQFISYLHSYLLTMAGELRLIPRKTRVKVEEGWKEVFLFDVPEWDEKEGKNELRRHVDWMVSQIESNRYRDEQGNENYALMHNDIKKWLQSQQLLRNVMKEKSIKVKCRKVTADNKVSSYPSSWESSNQWSGGEKWSKNMALFLGILNYLAEKRQAVNPRTKRSRTVILDNPFGKASSDHVLNPVFFIAEQLGFQIIALTALAEGKFVRDYFPIVFSCRLRPTANADKYVVTSEKEIRQAYFQDHEPEALKRLGEHEQVELF